MAFLWTSIKFAALFYLKNSGKHKAYVKKVKLSLCLTKHHIIKMYWGMEVYSSKHS